ncbi:NACHT domain-containing protein [Azospirillum argentinense]|uniref:Uncharacterized protein n=1 Tax=Azospirillum argentinense TaxID=2970906 RepID=A0A5B0KMM2_9PROT|nr:hypothetical protein [Azospirillum argentinense]KAA1053927.1 hypothetical protein FH063_002509 [Azospirillum argentinense]
MSVGDPAGPLGRAGSRARFAWERFWCRQGDGYTADGAFLSDPRGRYAPYHTTAAYAFAEVSQTPVLFLLGEPGIGKTDALRAAAAAARRAGRRVIELPLGTYAQLDDLVDDLFNAPDYQAACRGEVGLDLFLDGLDEAMLAIDRVHHGLLRRFTRTLDDTGRASVRVRIGCRTSDLPATLAEDLAGLWGDAAVGVYELLPLRRRDVEDAAAASGLSASRFLEVLYERQAEAFAAKPVTLGLLLRLFAAVGTLPERLTELYTQGCDLLCHEANPNRRELSDTIGFDVGQRLAVAKRLAAVSLLTNRRLVTLSATPEPGALRVADVAGGEERYDGAAFIATAEHVRDVLNTGLFTGERAGRLAWAHQTYAEFLAAHHLADQDLDWEALASLFGLADGFLVPALAETAAWLAVFRADVRSWLLERSPDVLLRSDCVAGNAALAADLTRTLLRDIDQGDLRPWGLGLERHYGKLQHPDLARALQPCLEDPSRHWSVRRTAMQIAEACRCVDVAPSLRLVAMSPDDNIDIRAAAIHCLGALDAAEARPLRALVLGGTGQALPLPVLNATLAALWPAGLTAAELFAILPTLDSDAFAGMRDFELGDAFAPLAAADVPGALDWLRRGLAGGATSFATDRVAKALLNRGFAWLPDPAIAVALADTALSMARCYIRFSGRDDQPYEPDGYADPTRRAAFLDAVYERLTSNAEIWSVNRLWRVFRTDDFGWTLARFAAWVERHRAGDLSEERLRLLASVVVSLADFADEATFAAVYELAQHDHHMCDALREVIGPIAVDSERARRLREQHRDHVQWEQRRKEEQAVPRPLPESRTQALDASLARVDNGDRDQWWRVDWAMNIDNDPDADVSGFVDIAATPGWTRADTTMRQRLQAGMRAYLLAGALATAEWWDAWMTQSQTDKRPVALCRAMRHLRAECPSALEALTPERWAALAPAIVAVCRWDTDIDTRSAQTELLDQALTRAPAAALEAIRAIVQKDIAAGSAAVSVPHLHAFGHAPVLDLYAGLLEQPDRFHAAHDYEAVLSVVHRYRPDIIAALLARWVEPPAAPRAPRLRVAHALLHVDPAASASTVLGVCHDDPDFASTLWLSLGREVTWGLRPVLEHLTADQRADLCGMLHRLFPPGSDPRHDTGSYTPTPRDDVAHLRSGLLASLEREATPAAVAALAALAAALPQEHAVRMSLRQAKIQEAAQRYPWPSPEEVRGLIATPRARLVRSSAELLRVVQQALRRFEAQLRAGGPAVRSLWNETPALRPKDGGVLADAIRLFLHADLARRGALVNREVDIRFRGGMDGTPGEGAALLVQVRGRHTHQLHTVVIAVKESWNPDLLTALESQLVDRDLRDHGDAAGIYAVGWYACPSWSDATDRRQLVCAGRRPEATMAALAAEAARLTAAGRGPVAVVALNAALR